MRYTGSIAPSSKFLARDITQILQQNLRKKKRSAVNILEIGPGTGAFTKRIIKNLGPKDHFDIVEINKHFFDIIEKKYGTPFNVKIHNQNFLNFDSNYRYDYIFSSIPYESLPKGESRKIWKKKLEYCKQGTYITYYKYLNFKKFRCKYEKDLVSKYCCDEKLVLLNLPPAKLFTLEIKNHPLIIPVESLETEFA
ncbi:MAG TPA: rRNA adenine N-6-methyltransferase family protein [Balneolales bacterium]|nr:rRNA adenine N-6-methyltransferase family protein [Balneolales bacterium]